MALHKVSGIAMLIVLAACPAHFVLPQAGPHGCAKGEYWISYNTKHCRSGRNLSQTSGPLDLVAGTELCFGQAGGPIPFGINIPGTTEIRTCYSLGADPSKFRKFKGDYVDASLDSQARIVAMRKHVGLLPT